jgi:hypothetical protein
MSKQLPILLVQCLIIGIGAAVLAYLAYSAYISIWIGSFAPTEAVRKAHVSRLALYAILALVTFVFVLCLLPAVRRLQKNGEENGTGFVSQNESDEQSKGLEGSGQVTGTRPVSDDGAHKGDAAH